MQVHKNTYKEERGEADTAQVEFVFAIPVAVAVPLLCFIVIAAFARSCFSR